MLDEIAEDISVVESTYVAYLDLFLFRLILEDLLVS